MKEILDHSQLSRLCRWYEDALKLIPEAKTRALRAAADAVKQELDRQIASRLDDSHEKVRTWQQVQMGSKGGYSRVGPGKQEVANQYGKKYGYTAAQVTSYLERGHAVPSPTGKSQRYRPNLEKAILGSAGNAVVPGRQFYSYTRLKASDLGIAAMEDELDRLTDEFVDLLAEV